jgi:hypothetical protein
MSTVLRLTTSGYKSLRLIEKKPPVVPAVFLFGSGLVKDGISIIVIDNYVDLGRVHGQRFAERTGLAYQHAATLAQGAVGGLDDVGLPFALGTGPVLPAGQHFGVGFPLVGEVPAVAVSLAGPGVPALAQGRFAPAAQGPAHDASPGPFDGEPAPHLALFVAHKAPQLVEFQDFPLWALRFFGP